MINISKINDIQNHDYKAVKNSELSWIIKEKFYLGPYSLSNMYIVVYSDPPNGLYVMYNDLWFTGIFNRIPE